MVENWRIRERNAGESILETFGIDEEPGKVENISLSHRTLPPLFLGVCWTEDTDRFLSLGYQ